MLCFRQKGLVFFGELGSEVASLVLYSSIINNGCPRGKIIPTCGIRQGDPSSPFLFILVANSLSRLLDLSSSFDLITTHPIENSTFSLNHLQFADDTLLFSIAERTALRHLFDIVQIFDRASRLKFILPRVNCLRFMNLIHILISC